MRQSKMSRPRDFNALARTTPHSGSARGEPLAQRHALPHRSVAMEGLAD
jgi:hypothetical protein